MVNIRVRSVGWFFGSLMIFFLSCPALAAAAEQATGGAAGYPWWFWPVILFFFCLILGILAVMAGVGGGVLYVPLVSGFFPFHIDFVRGVGLMVALAGALAAGPGLLRRNLANLRLALPVALVASTCSIVGAMLGLYLSSLNPNIIQACLGITIVGIAMLLLFSKNTEKPVVTNQDAVGLALGLRGAYWDDGARESVEWKTHRTLLGLCLFILVGLLAGITDTSAAWIYMNRGCVIPLIGVPSIVGLMLGSLIGVKILAIAKPKIIRYMVIIVLLFAGLKAMDKGFGLGLLG
jgi:hypothetical protein